MPVLGLDFDDTVFHYLKGLQAFIVKKESAFFKDMTLEQIDSHFPELESYDKFIWTLIGNDRSKFEQYHCEAVEAGLFKDLEVMDNASAVFHKLIKEHGFEIYGITKRFVRNGQHARVLTDTAISLDKHDIPFHDIMFVRNKVDVMADVYLDDSPGNINALRAAGRTVVVFDQKYNRDLAGPRVSNWNEAYDLLSTMF